MQGNGQFDYAEPRTQVTAGDGNCVDRLVPQLRRDLREIGLRQATQIGWRRYRVQKWGLRCRHNYLVDVLDLVRADLLNLA
jgi:hypothetical protein